MSDDDRQRWNERYTRGDHASDQPSSLIVSVASLLPGRGRALDVAGGAGRHALWLAELGYETTLVDVSDKAIELARQRAADRSLALNTIRSDILHDALPAGPWDLIVIVHFLHRPLLAAIPALLAPGGVLVVLQPTRSNLERHARPPADYLLDDRELPRLIGDLRVVHYQEGWLDEGRHEALLVARRAEIARPLPLVP